MASDPQERQLESEVGTAINKNMAEESKYVVDTKKKKETDLININFLANI